MTVNDPVWRRKHSSRQQKVTQKGLLRKEPLSKCFHKIEGLRRLALRVLNTSLTGQTQSQFVTNLPQRNCPSIALKTYG